jgi:phospholipase/lecithinase/hemolysin
MKPVGRAGLACALMMRVGVSGEARAQVAFTGIQAFGDSYADIIQFNATSAPVIVNNWSIPNGTSQNVYGRVAAGVVAPVWSNVSLTANVSRTLGRQGGDDFYGTGGFNVSF